MPQHRLATAADFSQISKFIENFFNEKSSCTKPISPADTYSRSYTTHATGDDMNNSNLPEKSSVTTCSATTNIGNSDNLEIQPNSSLLTRDNSLIPLTNNNDDTQNETTREGTESNALDSKQSLTELTTMDMVINSPELTETTKFIHHINSSKLKINQTPITQKNNDRTQEVIVEGKKEAAIDSLYAENNQNQDTNVHIGTKAKSNSLKDQSHSKWAVQSSDDNQIMTTFDPLPVNRQQRESFQSKYWTPTSQAPPDQHNQRQRFKHALNNIKNAITDFDSKKGELPIIHNMSDLVKSDNLAVTKQEMDILSSRYAKAPKSDLVPKSKNIVKKQGSDQMSNCSISYTKTTRYSRNFLMRFRHINTPPSHIKYIEEMIREHTHLHDISSTPLHSHQSGCNEKYPSSGSSTLQTTEKTGADLNSYYSYSTKTTTGGLSGRVYSFKIRDPKGPPTEYSTKPQGFHRE